jgi:hypothetical protein
LLDLLLPAIGVLAAYVWLVLKANRKFRAFRKERFERTNYAGVLVFDSFEQLHDFEKRESRNRLWITLLAVPGGFLPLAALFVVIASVMTAIS